MRNDKWQMENLMTSNVRLNSLPDRTLWKGPIITVNKRTLALLPALALLFTVVFACNARAQRTAAQRPRTNTSKVLSTLPPSDAVIFIDVRRLLNEAIPGVFAAEPAKLAQVNTQIDSFKTKTGIDLRSFERLAVGLRYTYPAAGIT